MQNRAIIFGCLAAILLGTTSARAQTAPPALSSVLLPCPQLAQEITLDAVGERLADVLHTLSRRSEVDLRAEQKIGEQRVTLVLRSHLKRTG